MVRSENRIVNAHKQVGQSPPLYADSLAQVKRWSSCSNVLIYSAMSAVNAYPEE